MFFHDVKEQRQEKTERIQVTIILNNQTKTKEPQKKLLNLIVFIF